MNAIDLVANLTLKTVEKEIPKELDIPHLTQDNREITVGSLFICIKQRCLSSYYWNPRKRGAC